MRTCIVCQCTDVLGCHGSCFWSEKIGKDKGLCSQCPPPAKLKFMSREQKIERAKLQGLVKTRNTKRREIARSYLTADRQYFDAVRRLRQFESGIPL